MTSCKDIDCIYEVMNTDIEIIKHASWSSKPASAVETALVNIAASVTRDQSEVVAVEDALYQCIEFLREHQSDYAYDQRQRDLNEVSRRHFTTFMQLYVSTLVTRSASELMMVLKAIAKHSDDYTKLKKRITSMPYTPALAEAFGEVTIEFSERPYADIRRFSLVVIEVCAIAKLSLDKQFRALKWSPSQLLELYEDLGRVVSETTSAYLGYYAKNLVDLAVEPDEQAGNVEKLFKLVESFAHATARGNILGTKDEDYSKSIREMIKIQFWRAFEWAQVRDPVQLRITIVADILKYDRYGSCLLSPFHVWIAGSLKEGEWDRYLLNIVRAPSYRETQKNDYALEKIMEATKMKDKSLIPELYEAILEESSECVRGMLISRLAAFRPHPLIDDTYLPQLYDGVGQRSVALTIMFANLQPSDRPRLREMVLGNDAITFRRTALAALDTKFCAEDVDVFLAALRDPELCHETVTRLCYGDKQYPKQYSRIADALIDLLVEHRDGPTTPTRHYGDKTLVDHIIKALIAQSRDDVLMKIVAVINEYRDHAKLMRHCIKIITQLRLGQFNDIHRRRDDMEKCDKLVVDTFTDRQVEKLLESFLVDAECRSKAQKALWKIGDWWKRMHVLYTLNDILHPEDKAEHDKRYRDAHDEVLSRIDTDILYSSQWDNVVTTISKKAQNLKDDLPYHYLFLKACLPYDGHIAPWEFWMVFNAIVDIYAKLQIPERLHVLGAVYNFLINQSWETYTKEWAELQRLFAGWLDIKQEEIPDPQSLAKHLTQLIADYRAKTA